MILHTTVTMMIIVTILLTTLTIRITHQTIQTIPILLVIGMCIMTMMITHQTIQIHITVMPLLTIMTMMITLLMCHNLHIQILGMETPIRIVLNQPHTLILVILTTVVLLHTQIGLRRYKEYSCFVWYAGLKKIL